MAGIYVNTNIMAIDAHLQMSKAQDSLQVSLKRLASGLRINSASDDASGLAISEKMRAQIRGLHRASLNAQDGISMLQTAEGALNEIHGILQRMRELSVQASNGTLTATDRVEIQKEIQQLKDEIDRISRTTEFNTKKLLNGDAAALWSTNKADIVDAIIRGEAAEGTFNIHLTTEDVGKNQVLRTDIFTLREGALGIELTSNSNYIDNLSNVENMQPGSYKLDVVSAGAVPSRDGRVLETYLAGSDSGWVDTTVVKASTASTNFYVFVRFKESGTVDSGLSVEYKIVTRSGGETDWITGTLDGNAQLTVLDATIDFNTTSNYTGIYANAGDTVLIAVTSTVAVTDGAVQIQDSSGNPLSPYWDLGDTVSTGSTEVYFAQLDADTGAVNIGKFDISWNQATIDSGFITGNENVTFDVRGSGDVATSTTRLRDIARFYDPDGNFILSTPQKITIWNGPKSYDIYLDGDDTIGEVAQKIRDAIVKGLGLDSGSAEVNRHVAEYITPSDAATTGEAAVAGTIVIRSPKVGMDGVLSFSGDENIMKTLSLEVVQEAVNPQTKMEVFDAFNGTKIGEDVVSDGILRGVIKGVDVKIEQNSAVNVSWNSTDKSLAFSASVKTDIYLHIVDSSVNFQIGANQNQIMNTTIGRMDTVALGVADVLVVDVKHAEEAITKIDRAIQLVSSERGKLGAIINRLQKTISNLNTQRENMTASESRIRDLDMAAETINFTKSQILSQTAMAMLAQANAIPQQVLQLLR